MNYFFSLYLKQLILETRSWVFLHCRFDLRDWGFQNEMDIHEQLLVFMYDLAIAF